MERTELESGLSWYRVNPRSIGKAQSGPLARVWWRANEKGHPCVFYQPFQGEEWGSRRTSECRGREGATGTGRESSRRTVARHGHVNDACHVIKQMI